MFAHSRSRWPSLFFPLLRDRREKKFAESVRCRDFIARIEILLRFANSHDFPNWLVISLARDEVNLVQIRGGSRNFQSPSRERHSDTSQLKTDTSHITSTQHNQVNMADLRKLMELLPPELWQKIYDETFTVEPAARDILDFKTHRNLLQVDTISRLLYASQYYGCGSSFEVWNGDSLWLWIKATDGYHRMLIKDVVMVRKKRPGSKIRSEFVYMQEQQEGMPNWQIMEAIPNAHWEIGRQMR